MLRKNSVTKICPVLYKMLLLKETSIPLTVYLIESEYWVFNFIGNTLALKMSVLNETRILPSWNHLDSKKMPLVTFLGQQQSFLM